MKKITVFMLVLAAIFSLASCSGESTVEELTFNLQILQTNDESVLCGVQPSDMTHTYYYSTITLIEYNTLGGDDALVSTIKASLQNPDVQNKIASGYLEEYETDLIPETDYYLYAFALSMDGKSAGKVTKVQFTTGQALESFNCSISVLESSIISVRSKFVPGDEKERYFVGVVEKSVYDKAGGGVRAIQADFEEIIDMKKKENPYYSRETIVDMLLLTGVKTASNITLTDNTDYYIWASAVDANGIIVKKPSVIDFSTPEYIPSNAVVTADIPRYYDGDDAHEASYEYAYAAGYVITPVLIKTEGDVYTHILTFLGEEYASEDKYSDTDVISMLVKQGVSDIKNGSLFMLGWNPTTLCMVAQDKDGNYGPVFRKRFEFDKSKVSPISDIIR